MSTRSPREAQGQSKAKQRQLEIEGGKVYRYLTNGGVYLTNGKKYLLTNRKKTVTLVIAFGARPTFGGEPPKPPELTTYITS